LFSAAASQAGARLAPWRRGGLWGGVAALYVAITLFFWRHALAEFGSRFVGDGFDNFQFVWNAWWASQTLPAGRNPYFCDLQFVPFGVPLVFHTLALIPSLIIAGLTELVSMPLAYNLVAAGLYPLAGLCAFALARHVTRDVAGAIAGGLVYMICPFMTSKVLGHLNLECAALLPLYTLCLLGGLQEGPRPWKWRLTAVFALILFSNLHTTVFSANVTAWYLIYRGLHSKQWRSELQRFWHLLKPSAVIAAAWGAVLLYYTVRYQLHPKPFRDLVWCPEPLNFLLPLHPNSLWRTWVMLPGDVGWQLTNLELSVYLGWLVLPMAVAGFWCLRERPMGKFLAIVFICALALAPGHKLQWHRQVVRPAGVTAYLPMGLYRYVPVLGAVGQSGRYLVIGYMAMAVGVAGLISGIRRRWGSTAAIAGAVLAAGLTCVDYAYHPVMVDVPECAIPPGPGRVMDPRLGNARSLYFQTRHQRELVGGYIARIPEKLRRRYAEMPGLGWFFQPPDRRGAPPSAEAIGSALARLGIRYVCVDRGSADQQLLEACGLRPVFEDESGVTLIRSPP